MLRIALRGLAGALLGALPGSALAIGGMDGQGVGIAVIGAAIGTGLALSRALYGRSATDSLLRGSALFATMTAEKNLPLSGQWSDSLDRVTRPPQPSHQADQDLLAERLVQGAKVGVVAAVLPALGIAVMFSLQPADHIVERGIAVAQGLLVAFCFTFFAGGASGAVVGGLTVPGTHRRNILLGMFLGSMIGVGMAIAVTPAGSPSATLHYSVFSRGVLDGSCSLRCSIWGIRAMKCVQDNCRISDTTICSSG
jgi:hypothetical protein